MLASTLKLWTVNLWARASFCWPEAAFALVAGADAGEGATVVRDRIRCSGQTYRLAREVESESAVSLRLPGERTALV